VTVLRARADLYGKQVFYCTNTPNRFSTVQYRCIFVLLFGQYSLQLDNKLHFGNHDFHSHIGALKCKVHELSQGLHKE